MLLFVIVLGHSEVKEGNFLAPPFKMAISLNVGT